MLKKKISALAVFTVLVALLSSCSSSSSTGSTGSTSESAESETASDTQVGYRYWGYSLSSEDGQTWTTAMEGPATTVPKDGSVEGWNYTFSAEGVVDPTGPATAPNFAQLCASTPAVADQKRVAFVIEYGNPAIHPEGDIAPEPSSGCVSVPSNATGLEVLNKAAEVRAGEGGFICGLNGFPAKDCGADAIPVPESLRKQ